MGKKKAGKKDVSDDTFGIPVAEVEDDIVAPVRKSAFAAMTLDDDNDEEEGVAVSSISHNASALAVNGGDDDSDNDQFGGLMGAIKKNAKKDKKRAGGKKAKKQQDDDIWNELGESVAGNAVKKADQMEVDEEEKAGQPIAADDDASESSERKPKSNGSSVDTSKPATTTSATAEEEDNPHRLLTKKEKEKLKKEREKAKKKAEADAKKAANVNNAEETVGMSKGEPRQEDLDAFTIASATAPADEDGDDGEGDDSTSADKKKKKKKKKVAEGKSEASTTSTKKPSAALQALQARLAAQKKAEEEAKAAEEETKRREEELERLEREAEEKKEAERQRKKEKEKAKKEQLKKEGKLLTPKQKAEKAAAEARMQAMIKTGQVKIDGLINRQHVQEGEFKEKKKVVYDSRKKKKGPSGPPSKINASLAPPPPSLSATIISSEEEESKGENAMAEPEVVMAEKPTAIEAEETSVDEDVKEEWDAQSDDGVKDDWDAESTEEVGSAKSNGKSIDSAFTTSTAHQEEDKAGKARHMIEEELSLSEQESSEEELTVAQQMAAKKKAEAEQRRKERHEAALAATSKDNLRSPICCILGHVDTGKTSLLDKVRQTNVQEGEAGGITQQIGATYFPVDVLKKKIAPIDPEGKQVFNTPGLLVIDTPGHESFTNLRTRGSSLCNIAILVVDIMHGLEQQTLESIRLLRDRKTPFIVALNKVDRLYNWKGTPDGAFRESLAKQERSVQNEFQDRYEKTKLAFAEQGLNAVLYYENKNFAKNVSLVPTSAWTGEGIPDMLQLLVNLTQDRMSERLMYLSELECTVLEVKMIEGLGTTIDVILSNGVMYEGDKIVICGLEGPIVTQVRALLTPQPLKEMRVKGTYVHNKMVKAALGVKISAPGLEKALSGSRLLVCGEDDDEEELMDEVMSDLSGLLSSVDKKKGVCVQSSTLGSLEALLEFLKQSKIPVNGINIGPVSKKDVKRCATMLEKFPDLAVMLCFDVNIDKEAEALAVEMGVKIFSAKIIYHLFDAFVAHQKQVLERKQKENSTVAVWPCRLKILAVFCKRAPLILGCEVVQGDLRLDTPIAVKSKTSGEIIRLGRVTSLEVNHKRMDIVNAKTQGAGVAVRIECAAHETPHQYGRHFTDEDELFSHISRQSIDSLKDFFWDSMTIEQKKTIKYLKTVLNIT